MIVICKLQMNFQILQSSGAGSSGVFTLPIKQQLTTFFYMKARNMRLQIHSKHVRVWKIKVELASNFFIPIVKHQPLSGHSDHLINYTSIP